MAWWAAGVIEIEIIGRLWSKDRHRSKDVAIREAVYPSAGSHAHEKGHDEAKQCERVYHPQKTKRRRKGSR